MGLEKSGLLFFWDANTIIDNLDLEADQVFRFIDDCAFNSYFWVSIGEFDSIWYKIDQNLVNSQLVNTV